MSAMDDRLLKVALNGKGVTTSDGERRDCVVPFLARVSILALTMLSVLAQDHSTSKTNWYKGIVHAHANWGAAQLPTTSPDVVVRWYREHNYNFVSVTDLNYYTPPEGLKSLFDAPGRFLVIPGTELSKDSIQPGNHIVDTIGLGVRGPIDPPAGDTIQTVLDNEAKAIRQAGGLPIAAHPNLTYALTAADLLAVDNGAEAHFFEVWNSEPGMNNLGGGGKPSTERIWDQVLSAGRLLYATAVDDSHHFDTFTVSRRAEERLSNPGKAWIMVRATELSVTALMEGMKRGDFYASTGVVLESYEVTNQGIRIRLNDRTRDLGWSLAGTNPQLYRTDFIGQAGQILKTDESLHPVYEFTGSESYVRAHIVNSDGEMAWTQPVFPK